jgi:hypothetical protein
MIIYISQNKLFELLQSEKFVVGNSLFAKAIQLIENLSNRFLKEKKISKKLLANFIMLRNKWKKMKGGQKIQSFKENIFKLNFVLEICDEQFEQGKIADNNEQPCVNRETIDSSQEMSKVSTSKPISNAVTHQQNWDQSKKEKRRRMRIKIQQHLSSSNNFLKQFGLCFKNIEICNATFHTYSNTFKLTNF